MAVRASPPSSSASRPDTHEWCAPGIEPQTDELQRVPADSIRWWFPEFERGNVVDVPSVADLTDDRTEDREPWAWSDGAIRLLRAVADAICSAPMRREAIEALTQREERFRALVRHSSDVVLVLDAAGTVSHLGPSAEQVLGWNVDNRTRCRAPERRASEGS